MRNAERLTGDRRLLIVNPPDDGLAPTLHREGVKAATLFSQSFSRHCFHEDRSPADFNCVFGARCGQHSHDRALVFLSREKALTRMLLQMAASNLAPGGDILLVGENRAGARSAGRLLAEVCHRWNKIDSARHCTLYAGDIDETPAPLPLADVAQRWQQVVAGQTLELVSLPGVFSHGELDPATRMLLANMPRLEGDILDFGCGNGAIGLYLARRSPDCRAHLIDDSALALEAARMSFALNGIEAASITASDGFSRVVGRFDAIVSNPPFHRGVATDYRTTEALIEQAPEHLNPRGQLIIVANAFLDYPLTIERRFGNCRTLAADRRFRVYQASRK